MGIVLIAKGIIEHISSSIFAAKPKRGEMEICIYSAGIGWGKGCANYEG